MLQFHFFKEESIATKKAWPNSSGMQGFIFTPLHRQELSLYQSLTVNPSNDHVSVPLLFCSLWSHQITLTPLQHMTNLGLPLVWDQTEKIFNTILRSLEYTFIWRGTEKIFDHGISRKIIASDLIYSYSLHNKICCRNFGNFPNWILESWWRV